MGSKPITKAMFPDSPRTQGGVRASRVWSLPVRTRRSFVRLAAGTAILPALSGAGEKDDKEPFTLSVDVKRVVLTATVERRGGGLIPDLTKENFRIFDNGRPQELIDFVGTDQPATVGLVVDNSRSMTPKRLSTLNAAAAFVARSNPQDDFFVVHFNDFARLGLPGDARFSNSPGVVREALWDLKPDGRTALYDAVNLALDHALLGTWEKRALLVVSDGADNASKLTFDELLYRVSAHDALIYALGIYDDRNPDRSPGDLKKLAKATGARALFPKTSQEVLDACEQVAREIRRQYTLVYSPDAEPDADGYHRVDVRLIGVDERGAKVRVREGYRDAD